MFKLRQRHVLLSAGLAIMMGTLLSVPTTGQTPPTPAPTSPAAPTSAGGPFDVRPSNLTVLPATMTPQQLRGTMVAFSRALGVDCQHCHAGRDFASDANPKKGIARAMMRMTWTLNNTTLPEIEGLNQTRVSCYSCHRGAVTPALSPSPPATAPTPPTDPAPTPGG